MAANKFQPGDVVELLSGGPRMVVAFILQSKRGIEEYACVWADTQGLAHEAAIPAVCLKKSPTPLHSDPGSVTLGGLPARLGGPD